MISRSVGFISLLLVKVVRLLVVADRFRGRVVIVWFMSGHRACEDTAAGGELGVSGEVGLAWPTAGPLAGDDHTVVEDLAAPYAPGLGPVEGSGEALHPDRAVDTQGLREFEFGRRVGEPQVWIEPAAGHFDVRLD